MEARTLYDTMNIFVYKSQDKSHFAIDSRILLVAIEECIAIYYTASSTAKPLLVMPLKQSA